VPVVLLCLIGNLKVRDPVTRVAVVADKPHDVPLARLQSALQELSSVEVTEWNSGRDDLRERSVRNNVDLVIVREGPDWRFYSPLTNSYRLQFAQGVVQDVALSMQRYTWFDEQLKRLDQLAGELRTASGAAAEPYSKATAIQTVHELEQKAKKEAALPMPVLRAWLSSQLILYFPLVSQMDHSLVPGFIALIAVFLPFLLASGGLVREREAGTLETLVIVARRSWTRMAAGKLLMPVFAAMLSTMLLLVAAHTLFGFGIKPGIFQALGIQLVAAVTSALLGFSIATLIKSAQDAYTTSAVYLVACILITGLIYPVEQAARGVLAVSYAFPLTISGPPLEDWMLKGASATVDRWRWAGLFAQLVTALSLCAFALRRLQRRL
jgi:ABC-type multidrug transport system permease subunit